MSEPNVTKRIELLAFKLGGEEYALDIMCVREIRGWTRATPMPLSPSFMRGVINLRGTVLPVMDLAERLGLPKCDQTDRRVIVVVKAETGMTGFIVDAVSDIVAIDENDMQAAPEMTMQNNCGALEALALFDDRMIRVLSLPKLVSLVESDAA